MYIMFCKCIRNAHAFSLCLSLSLHLSCLTFSRLIYAELLLIRFLSCPWESLCGISRISRIVHISIKAGYPTTLLPCSPPYPCPLCLPGKGTHLKRVNLVRLYFFINLSGAVDAGSDASSEASSAKKRTLQRPDLQSQIILLLIPFRSKVLS